MTGPAGRPGWRADPTAAAARPRRGAVAAGAAGLVLLLATGCSAAGTAPARAAGSAGDARSAVPATSGAPVPPAGTPSAGTAAVTASPRAAAAPSPVTAPAARPTPSPAGATGAGGAAPAVDRLVAAGGVSQWVTCAGQGSPTLVIVPGLGAGTAMWQPLLPGLAALTRTCVYDRPGVGRSPAGGPQPTDATTQVAELDALLAAVGAGGPLVLLGHSYGGLVARAYAHAHPDRVRGLLLAEAVAPADPTNGAYWPEGGGRIDMRASGAAAEGGFGALPTLVLSASDPDRDYLGGPPYGQPAWQVARWVREQAAQVSLSSNAVRVVAHSAHVLPHDDPAAVVTAVGVLLDAVTHGTALSCRPARWAAAAARCPAG